MTTARAGDACFGQRREGSRRPALLEFGDGPEPGDGFGRGVEVTIAEVGDDEHGKRGRGFSVAFAQKVDSTCEHSCRDGGLVAGEACRFRVPGTAHTSERVELLDARAKRSDSGVVNLTNAAQALRTPFARSARDVW